MTTQDWRALRNYLQGIACTIDTNSIEYRNINRRIRWIHDNRL